MAETHACEECGKRLATIGGLEIHMALAHGGAFPDPSVLEMVDDQPAMTVEPAIDAAFSPPMTKAPEVRGARPPRAPLFGGIDPAEPLAWVLTVLLFLGSVTAAIRHPHPPSDVTTVVSASSSAAPGAAPDATAQVDDQNQLAGLDLTVGDVDRVWTLRGSRALGAGELQELDGCLSPPATGSLVAARLQTIDYQNGGGDLYVTSAMSSTAQDATSRLAATASPQYLQCEIHGEEQQWLSEGATLEGTTAKPLDVSLPVPSHVYQYVTHFTRGGVDHTWTTDDFQLAVGRVKTHLIFGHCACTPYDVQQDVAVVNIVAAKLQHLAVQA